MRAIETITGRVSVLDRDDVDTDQIIPKQFLKRVERTGFGEYLFYDWAKEPGWELPSNPVLVAGRNFGCGSSREHAPWALLDYGFRAVISTQIADIFRSNALKCGLLPVVVDAATASWLIEHPGAEVSIDLPTATLTLPAAAPVAFPLETFARMLLVNGIDELEYLLERDAHISAFERRRSQG
jgi:3-isopropylmalate/(R)-2-methylmalate dehydratase small subunit